MTEYGMVWYHQPYSYHYQKLHNRLPKVFQRHQHVEKLHRGFQYNATEPIKPESSEYIDELRAKYKYPFRTMQDQPRNLHNLSSLGKDRNVEDFLMRFMDSFREAYAWGVSDQDHLIRFEDDLIEVMRLMGWIGLPTRPKLHPEFVRLRLQVVKVEQQYGIHVDPFAVPLPLGWHPSMYILQDGNWHTNTQKFVEKVLGTVMEQREKEAQINFQLRLDDCIQKVREGGQILHQASLSKQEERALQQIRSAHRDLQRMGEKYQAATDNVTRLESHISTLIRENCEAGVRIATLRRSPLGPHGDGMTQVTLALYS